MPEIREILQYEPIDSESSAAFIRELSDADGADIKLRVNGPGGNPEYAFGMIAKILEYPGNVEMQVDGMAYSGHAFELLYSKMPVSALDVAEFLFHRAAYPSWFESDPELFTQPLKENLIRINKSLEKAFRAKIDVQAFEELKQVKAAGVTVDSLFSMDARQDVFLSASDAKKIGLIQKITKITPQMQVAIQTKKAEILARYMPETKTEPIKNDKIMTLAELKEKHPEIYAMAHAEGVKAGIEQGMKDEQDRVESIMAYNEIDPKGVAEAIASGKKLTEKQRSDFSIKMVSKTALGKLTEESAKEVKTTETKVDDTKEKTAEEKKKADMSAFEKEVMDLAGIKK